ncbi:hypothetical protein [Exiguobacterium artemiae]|uniref:hypothetical protein n=1 Tax=Exiguobacterium artemiae TaxID=340145 RepID=UPI0029641D8E|nr:hypothetical protein [Exiguobacterium sibiricum]MDW2886697.1 hypothetical protein [Exiguobacterium sibiricum]
MALFYLDDNQMNFLQIIIGHLENIPSLDAKAQDLRLKGMFAEENAQSIIEIQIEDIISDLEQEKGITINYSKDDLETIAGSLRHFDKSDLYNSIEEGIRDVLL